MQHLAVAASALPLPPLSSFPPDVAFAKIYEGAMWRTGDKRDQRIPLSGGGSTLEATNVTCKVLLAAVRHVTSKRRGPTRILDTPCGDFTWMGSCLRRIAKELQPDGGSIVYRGIDVVSSLVDELNARGGHLLTGARDFNLGVPNVRILPFVQADASNLTQMVRFTGRVDVILSKHMLIHLPNAHVENVLHAWDSIGASLLVKDNTPNTRKMNRNTVMAGHHEVDVHAGPFHVAPPLCAQPDAGLCAAQHKCNDRIEILSLPLARMTPVPDVATRLERMAAVPACDVWAASKGFS